MNNRGLEEEEDKLSENDHNKENVGHNFEPQVIGSNPRTVFGPTTNRMVNNFDKVQHEKRQIDVQTDDQSHDDFIREYETKMSFILDNNTNEENNKQTYLDTRSQSFQ